MPCGDFDGPFVSAARPWVHAADPLIGTPPPDRSIPSWPQPVRAQPEVAATTGWWWLAAHGGAGVGTLQRWAPGGADAGRAWPDPVFGGPPLLVIVCRTHVAGLAHARDAARQWAAADVPAGLLLAGAVAVADAGGRLSRPQTEALQLLSAVVPRLWWVPWVEQLRAVSEPALLERIAPPPSVRALAADLLALPASDPAPVPYGPRSAPTRREDG